MSYTNVFNSTKKFLVSIGQNDVSFESVCMVSSFQM